MKLKLIIIIIPLVLLFVSCGKEESREEEKPLYQLVSRNESLPEINGESCLEYVKKQVSFGPRNPGSAGHNQALGYLKNELSKFADNTELQSFSYPGYDETLQLTNIIGRFNISAKNRILLCAHWDSRPRAEKDKDTSAQKLPIAGANDGASGVAVLLEVARILKEKAPSFGIDIIFFDGEDYGHENDLSNYCLGAKYFSANPGDYKPAFAILLDMVGDKNAKFMQEETSMQYAPDIVTMIWNTAAQVNASSFVNNTTSGVYDDHVPLNQAGIPAIDIIDQELIGADTPYPERNYWHTQGDTPDKLSSSTLKQVGDVLIKFIYSLKFNS